MTTTLVKNGTVSLAKGQKVSLSKNGEKLKSIKIGSGWDPIEKVGAPKKGFFSRLLSGDDEIDLDSSVILLDADGNALDVIWFNQLKSKCGSVIHNGDNRTGKGDGDDEVISVDLLKLSSDVKAIAITLHSFQNHTFNDVENCYCRVLDDNNKELVNFDLKELCGEKAAFVAGLVKKGDDWEFVTVGKPSSGSTVLDALDGQAKEVLLS